MVALLIVVALVIAVFVLSAAADKMVALARMKGYDPKQTPVFAICFFTGVLGCLYVVGLPDKNLLEKTEKTNQLLEELIRDRKL